MAAAIATLGSPDDDGRTVTSAVSTKFRVNGKFIAFYDSVLTGNGTAYLRTLLSTKLKVQGKFVGKVGSKTDQNSTITEGEPKMLVI